MKSDIITHKHNFFRIPKYLTHSNIQVGTTLQDTYFNFDV